METTAIISAVLKIGAALIPVMFFWLGYSKGRKSGYTKGVSDEILNSDKKMADLARKLYSNPDSHFGVPDVQAWGAAPNAGDKQAGVEPSRNTNDIRATSDGTVSDDRGES